MNEKKAWCLLICSLILMGIIGLILLILGSLHWQERFYA